MEEKNKNRCVIICASPKFYYDYIDENDFVIACDGGYQYVIDNDITADMVVGDFDSFKSKINENIKIIKAPVMKDDTDTMLAIKFGLDRGFRNFSLFGATGGRIDHFIANLNSAAFIASKGGVCKICDKDTLIYTISNSSIVIEKREGYSLSVISHTNVSEGVFIEGSKYTLENAVLNNIFPLGVSNEIVESEAVITVKSGIVHIILSNLKNE